MLASSTEFTLLPHDLNDDASGGCIGCFMLGNRPKTPESLLKSG
jgi:hypothetical protein